MLQTHELCTGACLETNSQLRPLQCCFLTIQLLLFLSYISCGFLSPFSLCLCWISFVVLNSTCVWLPSEKCVCVCVHLFFFFFGVSVKCFHDWASNTWAIFTQWWVLRSWFCFDFGFKLSELGLLGSLLTTTPCWWRVVPILNFLMSCSKLFSFPRTRGSSYNHKCETQCCVLQYWIFLSEEPSFNESEFLMLRGKNHVLLLLLLGMSSDNFFVVLDHHGVC